MEQVEIKGLTEAWFDRETGTIRLRTADLIAWAEFPRGEVEIDPSQIDDAIEVLLKARCQVLPREAANA